MIQRPSDRITRIVNQQEEIPFGRIRYQKQYSKLSDWLPPHL